MDDRDALKVVEEYRSLTDHGREARSLYAEALGDLIEITKKPEYLMELIRYYGTDKRPDLERKYLEQAARYGYVPKEKEGFRRNGRNCKEETG